MIMNVLLYFFFFIILHIFISVLLVDLEILEMAVGMTVGVLLELIDFGFFVVVVMVVFGIVMAVWFVVLTIIIVDTLIIVLWHITCVLIHYYYYHIFTLTFSPPPNHQDNNIDIKPYVPYPPTLQHPDPIESHIDYIPQAINLNLMAYYSKLFIFNFIFCMLLIEVELFSGTLCLVLKLGLFGLRLILMGISNKLCTMVFICG